jgi:hypothetical protein
MRWILGIAIAALVAWAAFLASPFVALHRLAKAVEAQDLAQISARVNVRALRLSLSKQIASEYLRTLGRGRELDALNRDVAASAGATLVDPLVAQLVTPDALVALLQGRLPAGAAAASPAAAGISLDVGSLGAAARTFMASQSRGFRNIFIPLPDGKPKAEQVRLHLRLTGTTWRLLGVELPQPVVSALVKQLPRGAT